MTHFMKAAGLVGVLYASTCGAQAAEITGKDLSQWCTSEIKAKNLNDAWCRGYVAGIADLFNRSGAICLPPQENFKAQAALLGAYFAAYPDRMDKPAIESMAGLFGVTYPCDKGVDEMVKPQKPHYGW
jgi:hypothetical protein